MRTEKTIGSKVMFYFDLKLLT